jgi:hypothetical protein
MFLKSKSQKEATIISNPMVIAELLKDKESLRALEHRFRAKINLIPNPASHIEDLKIS